ncbi:hypothetical protein PBOI14_67660 [Pseudomonas sp. Boi14]|nr:hypothetical protein PBOI14_67660 [Pseudomonas sp. Boi14]
MIGAAHDVPDLLISIHVTAPGQGFVADAQAPGSGPLGQQVQVVDEDLPVPQAVRRGVAAHQHQVGAQLLHQVELALGALQVARQTVATTALEIPEWLEQGDGNAQVGAHLLDFPRAAVVVEQVVLEDLHAVEPGGGDGFEFLRQGTAQGHGGNGTLHDSTPGLGRPVGHRGTAAFYWMLRIIPQALLKCTNQLVLCSIIEQNTDWRIDDFSATAHHR